MGLIPRSPLCFIRHPVSQIITGTIQMTAALKTISAVKATSPIRCSLRLDIKSRLFVCNQPSNRVVF